MSKPRKQRKGSKMPLSEAQVNTANGAPAPPPAAPKGKAKLEVPAVLQQDVALRAVLEQKIPGVVVPPNINYPQANAVAEHHKFIQEKMGLQFYRAKDNGVALFNPVSVSLKEITAADKKGELYALLPEYGKITGATPDGEGTGPPPGGSASVVPPAPQGLPKPPAKLRNLTQAARVSPPDLAPGASSVLGGLQARAI